MSGPYGGLPQAPQPPQGWNQPMQADRGPRPSSVENAVRLMLVNAAIGLIGVIVLFATKDSLRKQILKNTPTATDSTVNAAITVGAVIGIVFLVLYILLAMQVRKGKNWARIVTWVFAGLGVLSALTSLAGNSTTSSRVLSLIQGLIDLAIIILLAQRPSNDFFRRPRF